MSIIQVYVNYKCSNNFYMRSRSTISLLITLSLTIHCIDFSMSTIHNFGSKVEWLRPQMWIGDTICRWLIISKNITEDTSSLCLDVKLKSLSRKERRLNDEYKYIKTRNTLHTERHSVKVRKHLLLWDILL